MQHPSSNSPIETWPGRAEVVAALRIAAARLLREHPEVIRVGYFGSLTDGRRYGFGSDADVVIVIRDGGIPFVERLAHYHPEGLPVPADVVVYTEEELSRILSGDEGFGEVLRKAVWLASRGE